MSKNLFWDSAIHASNSSTELPVNVSDTTRGSEVWTQKSLETKEVPTLIANSGAQIDRANCFCQGLELSLAL